MLQGRRRRLRLWGILSVSTLILTRLGATRSGAIRLMMLVPDAVLRRRSSGLLGRLSTLRRWKRSPWLGRCGVLPGALRTRDGGWRNVWHDLAPVADITNRWFGCGRVVPTWTTAHRRGTRPASGARAPRSRGPEVRLPRCLVAGPIGQRGSSWGRSRWRPPGSIGGRAVSFGQPLWRLAYLAAVTQDTSTFDAGHVAGHRLDG